MINYPIIFEAQAEASAGIKALWTVEASGYSTSCSIPGAFDGPGGALSPEDFFLMGLQNCFIATFKVFAEYSRLKYDALQVQAGLKVNKDVGGKPWMESVELDIVIVGVEDHKRAQLLINKTLENGFILRSVKTEITAKVKIN
jgi:organic hydroperoxide reductase OsmC/OhrA